MRNILDGPIEKRLRTAGYLPRFLMRGLRRALRRQRNDERRNFWRHRGRSKTTVENGMEITMRRVVDIKTGKAFYRSDVRFHVRTQVDIDNLYGEIEKEPAQ